MIIVIATLEIMEAGDIRSGWTIDHNLEDKHIAFKVLKEVGYAEHCYSVKQNSKHKPAIDRPGQKYYEVEILD